MTRAAAMICYPCVNSQGCAPGRIEVSATLRKPVTMVICSGEVQEHNSSLPLIEDNCLRPPSGESLQLLCHTTMTQVLLSPLEGNTEKANVRNPFFVLLRSLARLQV